MAVLFSLVKTTDRRPSYSHCYWASFSHRIAPKHMGMAKINFFSKITDSRKNIFFKKSKIKTTQDHRFKLNYLKFKNLKISGLKFISQFLKEKDDFFDEFPLADLIRKTNPIFLKSRQRIWQNRNNLISYDCNWQRIPFFSFL